MPWHALAGFKAGVILGPTHVVARVLGPTWIEIVGFRCPRIESPTADEALCERW